MNKPASQAEQMARLATLIESMDRRMQEDRQERKEDRADRQRREEEARSARKLDAERLASIEQRTAGLEADMQEVRPVTRMVTGWKFMAMGALGLLGLLGGAIMTFLKWIGITLPGAG